jgi:hypothetical protein
MAVTLECFVVLNGTRSIKVTYAMLGEAQMARLLLKVLSLLHRDHDDHATTETDDATLLMQTQKHLHHGDQNQKTSQKLHQLAQ